MTYLAAIDILGAASQLTNILVAGLVVLVGFMVLRALLKHSALGLVIAVALGAIVWMVLKTNLLQDAGQTFQAGRVSDGHAEGARPLAWFPGVDRRRRPGADHGGAKVALPDHGGLVLGGEDQLQQPLQVHGREAVHEAGDAGAGDPGSSGWTSTTSCIACGCR